MQNGSIVAVKKLPELSSSMKRLVKWLPTDDERTPYVLRDGEVYNGEMLFRLEEGVIGHNDLKQELGIPQKYFIELIPPEEQVNVDELLKPEVVEVS